MGVTPGRGKTQRLNPYTHVGRFVAILVQFEMLTNLQIMICWGQFSILYSNHKFLSISVGQ